ncbi:MAG TPA: hypothetical protein VF598_13450 [Hymenobacter sp.]|jgi:hypothetical protein
MKSLHYNQRGASPAAVVVVLVLIGLVGWFGYSSYQSKSTTGKTSSSSGTYDGWKSYRDASSGVTFKYPGAWNVFAYQPSQGTNAGKFTLLTVSPVTQQQRTGADSQKYAGKLALYLTMSDAAQVQANVSPSKPLYHKLLASEKILEKITINGASYSLRGYGVKTPDPLVAVEAVTCQTEDTCSSQIKRSNNDYISAIISTQASQQGTTAPLDLTTQDYKDSKLVLQSLKF